MFFGSGTLTLDGGTVVNSTRSTFLDKGRQTAITVDGRMMSIGVYTEPPLAARHGRSPVPRT
ncbi:hypothetical protein [Streptomyces broussonetiae]|uniref:hypothetical protein n=1 Tax=Streptomyces broussonetiae TaxID=2686304 RepID=UPI0035DA0068